MAGLVSRLQLQFFQSYNFIVVFVVHLFYKFILILFSFFFTSNVDIVTASLTKKALKHDNFKWLVGSLADFFLAKDRHTYSSMAWNIFICIGSRGTCKRHFFSHFSWFYKIQPNELKITQKTYLQQKKNVFFFY